MPGLQGVGHVSLTVTDVERAAASYSNLFDAEVIMSGEDAHGPLTICASPSIMFGFRKHASTSPGERFDPARVGLDHVGFHVESREELERWKERLDEQGVANSGLEDERSRRRQISVPGDVPEAHRSPDALHGDVLAGSSPEAANRGA